MKKRSTLPTIPTPRTFAHCIAKRTRLEFHNILKTTVHIPDKIFKAADQFATELEISRSELYTRALKNLIRHHRHAEITKALNLVYSDLEFDESELAFLDRVGRQVFERNE